MDYRVNRKWRFWLLTTATLLALGVTLSLGRWQLSRAAEKELIQSRIDAREKLPALGIAELLATAEPEYTIHRTIYLRGRWLSDKTVFLDNRPMEGKAGFYVVTPLLPDGERTAILVQRGWLPRNFNDRNQLPPLNTESGVVEVVGRVAAAPARLYELGSTDSGTIRQNLDVSQFAKEIQQPLLPVSVLQTGGDGAGLLREWPAVNSGVAKHYGYAFQWFGLAALIAILYVWFQIVRRFI